MCPKHVLSMSWGHAWGQDNARTVHAVDLAIVLALS